MKKCYITIICLLVFILDVLAQPCSVPALGTTYEANSNACILFPSVSSTEQLIVGNIYQIQSGNIYYDEVECQNGNPGRCDEILGNWSFSSNIRSFETGGNTYIEILNNQLATISFDITHIPLDYPEEDQCNTGCDSGGTLRIYAIGSVSRPICTELCPGVGLESTGFEGTETGWKYNVAPLNGEVYSDLDLVTSPEHTIVDGAGYKDFLYREGVSNVSFKEGSNLLANVMNPVYTPFNSSNQKAIALGHGNTRNLEGKNYYSATIEQTFFVGENYEPKLDIWYSWVAKVAPEGFNEKPIFSIKIFRFYEDRNSQGELITVKEEVYSHIDTQTTFDEQSGNKIWRHWWDKKTIDLTPYKLERLHIEITSYDKQGISRDYNSMAFVDISCSTCCTPSEVVGNNHNLIIAPISNGLVNIRRPSKICEQPDIASNASNREAYTPNFFYQVIDPNGEPHIIESEEQTISFRPIIEGQYQIRYKEDVSCCWSDMRDFPYTILNTQISESEVTFSNDLKNAAISCIPSFEMDKVLAVNVASFGDRQLVDPKDIVTSNRKNTPSETVVTEPKNPYLTGERGIWRTEASYAYVTDREGYETETDINAVKEGGTFVLNMFNWTTQGVVPKNWRRVNHVSRYDGYTHEIENRDILGRYSSALYGYNGQLATAVASNAAYYEIANEGFDAYQVSEDSRVRYLSDYCDTGSGRATIVPYNPPNGIINVGGATHEVEYHAQFSGDGYEKNKKYAFKIEPINPLDNCIFGNYNILNAWQTINPATGQYTVGITLHPVSNAIVVVEISPFFALDYFYLYANVDDFSTCPNEFNKLCIRNFVRQTTNDPIQTETNFEINNLYKDGDKDRNVVLQVLWAKGDKGVVEGYTPGEGETATLDASVLAYTIGKQGAIDITPDLSVNTDDNEYTISEKVKITLRHRDATTSWFKLESKDNDSYTLPEEWMQKEEQWYGSVRLARTLPRIGNTDSEENPRNYEALTSVAHTGNRGLVPSKDIIIQEKLLLIPGKEYVFSAWVKANISEDQPYTYGDVVGAGLSFYKNGSDATYTDPTNQNEFIIPTGSILLPNPENENDDDIRILKIHPTGAIIEGWQRIEATFVVPTGSMFIGVELLQPSNGAVYDDVRIYPANGMMKTYVYNPSNYLLQAVLDENNYATLYYYDEEQRLYLVQKETREGVQTIQETRSYIKPKPNGE